MSAAIVNGRVAPAELVRRHQAGVWRYLRFLGCDASQADDLTQETFLAVLRKPFEYRGEQPANAYLRTVARNQLLMAARRTRRRPRHEDIDAAEQVWAESVGDSSGDEFLDALDDCLENLAGRPAEAIRLRYRDECSRAQIAERLGMTEDGVKTILRRTRAALRECVERKSGLQGGTSGSQAAQSHAE